jgi:hypothetical protein
MPGLEPTATQLQLEGDLLSFREDPEVTVKGFTLDEDGFPPADRDDEAVATLTVEVLHQSFAPVHHESISVVRN